MFNEVVIVQVYLTSKYTALFFISKFNFCLTQDTIEKLKFKKGPTGKTSKQCSTKIQTA